MHARTEHKKDQSPLAGKRITHNFFSEWMNLLPPGDKRVRTRLVVLEGGGGWDVARAGSTTNVGSKPEALDVANS